MTSSTKYEFLCIVPDKPGALAKRLEVRGQHLEEVKPLVAGGSVLMGGAMFESHAAEGQTPAFKGSALLLMAESEEKAREALSQDIYSKTGVWDLENAQIIPFKCAVRTGM
ncbi:uncharacterized protein ACLA_046140 [Aspergillus clavatus NRRL 1]|uniref:YCII-related domain-containing protein n=1 Tax=Aspergillus clavatus (strain ATCC 1007 / CBS 513.65 / DSM 816 / NCTC 3887 / NRRL 1 / QM 1276 / 107) TaxID=344612 RepID=A1CGZ4_ASPCL|nr:uncharacterized protein ACLA_046140 [Aspergillus clavatus NRRL 1]EAW10149.1 conserved hypothetical protein [Aspergillus clavatus NRRL 1]